MFALLLYMEEEDMDETLSLRVPTKSTKKDVKSKLIRLIWTQREVPYQHLLGIHANQLKTSTGMHYGGAALESEYEKMIDSMLE